MLNRRDFFKLSVSGIAIASAEQTWPFRVYSFSKEIVVPIHWASTEEELKWAFSNSHSVDFMEILSSNKFKKLCTATDYPVILRHGEYERNKRAIEKIDTELSRIILA